MGRVAGARWHARPRNLTPGCAAFLIEKGSLRLPKALNGLTLSGPALAFRKLIKQIERALGESGPAPLQHPPASQAPTLPKRAKHPKSQPKSQPAGRPTPKPISTAGKVPCPGDMGAAPTRVPPAPAARCHISGRVSRRDAEQRRAARGARALEEAAFPYGKCGGWHKSLRSLLGFKIPGRAPHSGSCFPVVFHFAVFFCFPPRGRFWMAGGKSRRGVGRAGGPRGRGCTNPHVLGRRPAAA